MATTGYFLTTLNYTSTLNSYTPGYQYAGDITTLANNGFMASWQAYYSSSISSYNYISGQALNASGAPVSAWELPLASYGPTTVYDSDLATLKNGNVAAAYTSAQTGSASEVKVDIYQTNFNKLNSVVVASNASDGDVVGLSDGGFAVAYTYQFSSGDLDTRAAIYNADGSLRANIYVNSASYTTFSPKIAALTNNNIVVAYAQETAIGSGSYQLDFSIYDAAGNLVTSRIGADTYGKYNTPYEMIGLKDGGFAVVYQDTGWSYNDTDSDITLGIWNANGTFRTWAHANAPSGGAQAGAQYNATVAQLDNGYIVVGWSNNTNNAVEYSVWTPTGTNVFQGTWLANATYGAFASGTGGVIASVASNILGDGDGYGIVAQTAAFTRSTTGDASSETITGDQLRDYVMGYDGNDNINGKGANDTLDGGAGNDTINGDTGNDLIYGGAGVDVLIGGSGSDKLSYLTSLSGIAFDLASPGSNSGDAAGDSFSGFESYQGTSYDDILRGDAVNNNLDGADGNDSIAGRDGNDTLTGGYGNDTLDGGNGDDRLDGGGNDDILIGGAGADALLGGAGIDTASYANAAAGVVASLAASGSNAGDAAGDIYNGIENLIGSAYEDVLFGSSGNNLIDGGNGNDTLEGGSGVDKLFGGAGNDWLVGGVGADQLTGGLGADRFLFVAPTGGVDTIFDFSRAQLDKIALTSSAFGGITSLTAGVNFIANTAPGSPGAQPAILYNTNTGALSFDSNGSASGGIYQFALITGHPALTAGDFLFV